MEFYIVIMLCVIAYFLFRIIKLFEGAIKLLEKISASTGIITADIKDDPKFEEALNLLHKEKKISISYMQRKLGIGYSKASRIMGELDKLVTDDEAGKKYN